MILQNRFKEEDKIRVWIDHQYCAECNSNQNCSLHHIKGTESDSILNSIMLCYNCHKKADGTNVSNKRTQSKFLTYTLKYILTTDYSLKDGDIQFYNNNKELYN